MKEINIVELRDEKNVLLAKNNEILGACKAENRHATAEESDLLNKNEIRMHELNLMIEQRMDEMHSQHNIEGSKESKDFSIVRAIRNAKEGRAQEDSEKRFMTGGEQTLNLKYSTRAAMTANGGKTYGGITTEDQAFVLPLEEKLAVVQAGAQVLTGLKGNLRFPAMSDVTIAWDAENDQASDGGSEISTALSLSAKRLCAYVDISNQLLVQENQDIEMYVRNLIATNIAEKIESSILGKAAAGDGPAGIFNTKPSIKGDFSFAQLIAMETAVNSGKGLKGNLAYILHPTLWGLARQTPVTTYGGLILGNDNMIAGYKAFSSANCCNELESTAAVGSTPAVNAGYAAVFGNWADFIIGNWGDLGITVDPYSVATYGKTRLVVNSYWDYGMLHSGSFKTAALAVPA